MVSIISELHFLEFFLAQGVGQRLMDLGVFTEIQGGKHFVVSSSVYYQFCQSAAATPSHNGRHHTKYDLCTEIKLLSFICISKQITM